MRLNKIFRTLAVIVIAAGTAAAQTIDWSASNITISTEAELRELANRVNGTGFTANTFVDKIITLGADIDLTSAWIPIGDISKPFNGTFNGNGYSISNLSVSGVSYAGLFGYVSTSGQIGSVKVNVKEINGSSAGGLAGFYVSTKTIENCIVNIMDGIIGGGSVGGLVGQATQSPLIINNCYTSGKINSSGSNSCSGGLVGQASSIVINDCYTTGDVSTSAVSACRAGGLVGRAAKVTISNSYTTGNISTNNTATNVCYAGGLVGYIDNGANSIAYCYTTSNVSSDNSGGLVGSIGAPSSGSGSITSTISNCYTTGNIVAKNYGGGLVALTSGNSGFTGSLNFTVNNCYTTGNINGKTTGGLVGITTNRFDIINSYASGTNMGSTKGGIFGSWNSGTNTSVYYNSDDVNKAASAGSPTGINGVPSTQLKIQAIFFGWDFDNIWEIDSEINDGMPYLRGVGIGAGGNGDTDNGGDGDGSDIDDEDDTNDTGDETDVNGYETDTGGDNSDGSTPTQNIKKSDKKHGITLENSIVSDKAVMFAKLDKDKPAETKIVIYDAVGNVVWTTTERGDKEIVWNLTNSAGRIVANGSYLVVAEVKGMSGKMWMYSVKVGVRR